MFSTVFMIRPSLRAVREYIFFNDRTSSCLLLDLRMKVENQETGVVTRNSFSFFAPFMGGCSSISHLVCLQELFQTRLWLYTDLLPGPHEITKIWARNQGKVNCPHRNEAHDLDLIDQTFQPAQLMFMSQITKMRGQKYMKEKNIFSSKYPSFTRENQKL